MAYVGYFNIYITVCWLELDIYCFKGFDKRGFVGSLPTNQPQTVISLHATNG